MDEQAVIDRKIIILKSIFLPSVILGFIFLAVTEHYYPMVDEKLISYSIITITIVIGIFYIFKGYKNKFFNSYRAGVVLPWLLLNFYAVPFFIICTGYLINGAFDQRESETFEVKVSGVIRKVCGIHCSQVRLSLDKKDSYFVRVEDWRGKLGTVKFPIEKEMFTALLDGQENRYSSPVKGKHLTIITKPGLLGEEWVVSLSFNPMSNKTTINDSHQEQMNGGLSVFDDS
jgi:hypothetical protein